jgi:hypothetical protein
MHAPQHLESQYQRLWGSTDEATFRVGAKIQRVFTPRSSRFTFQNNPMELYDCRRSHVSRSYTREFGVTERDA